MTTMLYNGGTSSFYVTGGNTYSTVFESAIGSEIAVKSKADKDGGVNPRLYFKLVKSKLIGVELYKLREQLKKLQNVVSTAKELRQQALYEKLQEMIAITVREIEAAAIGCDRVVTRDVIEKFKKVRKEDNKPICFLEPWEKFPRIPPADIAEKIKRVQTLGVFDELWVLYLDYKRDSTLKTNKEKVKEKDPIVFGKFAYQPDKFYYVCDWVDEYCDLTLSEFIEQVSDPTQDKYQPDSVEFTPSRFEDIKKEVLDRHRRLQETNVNNWREQERKASDAEKTEVPKVKKPWYKFW